MSNVIYDSHGNVITRVATDYSEYNEEGVKLVHPCCTVILKDYEKEEKTERKIVLLK